MRATIITPTYNAVAHIDACIANVAAQGDCVLEHIIVDGGSTDGTLEAVRRLMTEHAHLRLLPGPDRGQSDAMNKATDLAEGDVIGILNVDDHYEDGAVAEGVATLALAERPTLVVGICRIVDEFHKVAFWNRPEHLAPEYLLQDSARYPVPANPSAYFYHRAVHDIVGGYDVDNRYAMDLDFLLACARRVDCRFTPRHWGNFRIAPGCKTYENIADGPALTTSIMRRHRRELDLSQRMRLVKVRAETALRLAGWHGLHRLGLR